MTDIDLDAVEARRRDVENVATAIGAMPGSVTHNVATIAALGTAAALSSADVPALVAEVRRLREELASMTASWESAMDERCFHD
jgi:cysteine sulfinate desulfinase/cysteine desulfurase-like protein